ncbi:hypothetical protein ACS5PK_20760 [Roseateles sp. DB2]|uniref:hypothetical protein n=1 Tax=Roseateles sp. DB2 TaxID=3453717 RepID=UPI003EEEBB78
MDNMVRSLKLVADGLSSLAVSDFPPDKYDEFQVIAEGLVQARATGLLYEVAVERSKNRATYGHATRFVVAGGLTPAGKQWLQEDAEYEEKKKSRALAKAAKPAIPKQPEILQLKPAFMGFSIDLKALWQRYFGKRRSDV